MPILTEAQKRNIIQDPTSTYEDLGKLIAQALLDWVEPSAEEGYGEEEINAEFLEWAMDWIKYDLTTTA